MLTLLVGTCCAQREFTTITEDGEELHHMAPIPFCVSAGPWCFGVCAPCWEMGGTMQGKLARCSLPSMMSDRSVWDEERARLGVVGSVMGELSVGDDDMKAFAEELLYLAI